jgi:hypothetical protein
MILSNEPNGGSSTTFLKPKAPCEETCEKMRDTSQIMEGISVQ